MCQRSGLLLLCAVPWFIGSFQRSENVPDGVMREFESSSNNNRCICGIQCGCKSKNPEVIQLQLQLQSVTTTITTKVSTTCASYYNNERTSFHSNFCVCVNFLLVASIHDQWRQMDTRLRDICSSVSLFFNALLFFCHIHRCISAATSCRRCSLNYTRSIFLKIETEANWHSASCIFFFLCCPDLHISTHTLH